MFRAVRTAHTTVRAKANAWKGLVKLKLSTSAIPGAAAYQVHPAVSAWVFGMGFMVAGMVTVGGVTRLTKSGLSMTSCK
jgi:hypothetical protein